MNMISAALLLMPVIGALLFGLMYAPVRASLNPGNEIMTASSSIFKSDTFSSAGSIGSFVQSGPAIVTGRWSLDVQNGNVSAFSANLTMINANGTAYHTIQLANLTATKVTMEANGTAVIKGKLDVGINGTSRWHDVDATIMLPKLRAFSMTLGQQAGAHFGNQPIFGISDPPQETVTSAAKNILAEGSGVFGNFSEKFRLPQLPNPFR